MTKAIQIFAGKILPLLDDQKGRFFSIMFKKKNGEYRQLTGRLGVSSHRKTDDKKSPAGNYNNPYVCVFDIQKQGYRLVNLETAISIRANKQTYLIRKGA